MIRRSEDELRPRNGHTLIAGAVCRISGCANQKELSLKDQEDNAREEIIQHYIGPVDLRVIATVGKGERLDRPELEQIEAAYRSREYDVFVYDDLSRLIRGGEAARLLGIGVDHDTRSICINDGIDTAETTWEEDALNACSENVAHNERTSKRIKQKCMNRFKKFGGAASRPIAGYIVPKGAKSYDDWLKDEAATPIIQEGKRLLRQTLDYSLVSDYFNQTGFAVGRHVRRKDWIGTLARNFYGNTLLKGKPRRGTRHTVKHHETGRRRPVRNPKGPTYYDAPHLAHLTAEEFDELQALLVAANAHLGRPAGAGINPLLGRSRYDSRFPGLHSRCWYCGSWHVWGANGITENLMCAASREWRCWHTIGFPGPMLCSKVVTAICEQLAKLDGLDAQFAALVEHAHVTNSPRDANAWKQLERDEAQHRRETENVQATMREVGPQKLVKETLKQLEEGERALLIRRYELEGLRGRALVLPPSALELHSMLEEELQNLAIGSSQFAKLMRQLVPDIYVYSVRLCEGGDLRPRAKVRINLAGTYPDVNLVPGLASLLMQDFTFDLFDPPQRVRIREEVVRLTAKGLAQRDITQEIDERPTQPAVQRSLALHRKMTELGLDSPYVSVSEPPDDFGKARHHKHPRYKFTPVDGYERPAL